MNSAVTEQPIETILSASINIKTCKTCQKELANQKRIYCSNPCKFATAVDDPDPSLILQFT